MSNKFKLKKHSRNVHSLTFDLPKTSNRQSVMMISDLHWDNPHCNRTLLKRHLDDAKKRNAPVVIVGDFFCAMEGRGDLRGNRNIRPEHNVPHYLDALIDTAAKWLEPYYSIIAVIGVGNHETSVNKRHDTDLTARLCQLIRYKGGIAQEGGYGGWIRLKFRQHGHNRSNAIYYHHGFGGGSASTRGTGHFVTHYGEQIDGADVIVAGHVHYKESVPKMSARLNHHDRVEQVTKHCIRLGTYKDEYVDGAFGFHVEKGRGARPLGGYYLNFRFLGAKGLKRGVEEII